MRPKYTVYNTLISTSGLLLWAVMLGFYGKWCGTNETTNPSIVQRDSKNAPYCLVHDIRKQWIYLPAFMGKVSYGIVMQTGKNGVMGKFLLGTALADARHVGL